MLRYDDLVVRPCEGAMGQCFRWQEEEGR
jgi:hypothetical protein